MLSRPSLDLRAIVSWKLVAIAGIAAVVLSLGFAYVARSAPASSTTFACVNLYTGQMRYAFRSGLCSAGEIEVSWNSFAGGDLDAAYVNEGQPDSINSPMIVDGAVTTDEILDGTILTADLSSAATGDLDAAYVNEGQSDSISSPMIVDGQVANADLGPDSVTTDKILNGTVSVDDLGDGSVGAGEVIDNSLTASDLGSASVGSDEIANGSILQDDLSAGLESWIDGQTLEGYEIVSMTDTFPDSGTFSRTVFCPSGKRVVGGGVEASETFDMFVVASRPSGSAGWRGKVFNDAGPDVTMTTYAICVGS